MQRDRGPRVGDVGRYNRADFRHVCPPGFIRRSAARRALAAASGTPVAAPRKQCTRSAIPQPGDCVRVIAAAAFGAAVAGASTGHAQDLPAGTAAMPAIAACRPPRRSVRGSASCSPAAARAGSPTSACSRCWRSCACPSTTSPRPAWARSSAASTRRACRRRSWSGSSRRSTGRRSSRTSRRDASSPSGASIEDAVLHDPARARLPRFFGQALDRRALRPESRDAAARAHLAPRRHRQLRPPADPVSRRRDRHGRRQGGRLRPRPAVRRDARQHVGAGRLRAHRDRRQDPGRRRTRQEPSGRHREGDGRRGRHRRQHRHAADDARAAVVVRRRRRAVDQHPDRAERARAARAARPAATC